MKHRFFSRAWVTNIALLWLLSISIPTTAAPRHLLPGLFPLTLTNNPSNITHFRGYCEDLIQTEPWWPEGQPAFVSSSTAVLSPDGRFVVSIDPSGPGKVLEVQTGNVIASFRMPDHEDGVKAFFSSSGKYLLVQNRSAWAGNGCVFTVELWDMETIEQPEGSEPKPLIDRYMSDRFTWGVALSSDETLFAIDTGSEDIELFDIQSGMEVAHLRSDDANAAMAFASDNQLFWAKDANGNTWIWDIAQALMYEGQGRQAVPIVIFHNDDKARTYIRDFSSRNTSSEGNSEWQQITVENASRLQPVYIQHVEVNVHAIYEWSPDSTLLAIATTSGVTLYHTDPLESVPLEIDILQVASLAFSPDSAVLAIGSESGNERITLWDTHSGEQIMALRDTGGLDSQGTMGGVGSLAFSRNGRFLAAQFWQSSRGPMVTYWVRLWNVQTGQFLARVTGGGAEVFFSPDSTRLVADARINSIRIWNIAELLSTPPDTIPLEEVVLTGLRPIRFSADGQQLAYYSLEAETQVWDLVQQAIVARYPRNTENPWSRITNPDNTIVIGYSGTFTVGLWSVNGGQKLAELPMDADTFWANISFDPAGTLVAVINDNGRGHATLRLWGVPGG